jgi:hypothetical protein
MDKLARRSTEQYDLGRFHPHGRAEVSFDGTLMRFESTGPFNREMIVATGMAMRELLTECPPAGPWAEIVRLHGSALIAMDVLPALEELIDGLAREGIASKATAIVASSDIEGFALMLTPYGAIYASRQRPFAAFATVEEAERWIAPQVA